MDTLMGISVPIDCVFVTHNHNQPLKPKTHDFTCENLLFREGKQQSTTCWKRRKMNEMEMKPTCSTVHMSPASNRLNCRKQERLNSSIAS